jgi:hypothetical protein
MTPSHEFLVASSPLATLKLQLRNFSNDAQSELHATLQTAFKTIEDVLIGQEKTIND